MAQFLALKINKEGIEFVLHFTDGWCQRVVVDVLLQGMGEQHGERSSASPLTLTCRVALVVLRITSQEWYGFSPI